jgi:hypothetical protein
MKYYILYNKDGKILQNISSTTEQTNLPLFGNYLLEVPSPINNTNLKKVVNGEIIDINEQQPNTFTYDLNRYLEYPTVREQLGMLWHDIDQGLFGDTAKDSNFYKSILSVKNQFPKS